MVLGSGKVALWLLDIQKFRESHIKALEALLSVEERARSEAFLFKRDRQRFILTRAMIRKLLGFYLRIAPMDIVFEQNQYGRPFVLPGQNTVGLDFNISHAEGLIVAAFLENGRIGVDVESLHKERSLEVATDFFSPAEVEELFQQPKGRRHRYFLNFWTLKEAYIKARGMGLALPLHTFGFCLENGAPQFCDHTGEQGAEDWQFHVLEYSQEYQLAVTAKVDVPDSGISLHQFSANDLSWLDFPITKDGTANRPFPGRVLKGQGDFHTVKN